jgi:hypothetical protein
LRRLMQPSGQTTLVLASPLMMIMVNYAHKCLIVRPVVTETGAQQQSCSVSYTR